MELLKKRILADGLQTGTELVKVDSFLNHQLDIGLFKALGKEIFCRFGHMGINKILTSEASGIGVATITSLYFDLAPVVFAKKSVPNALDEDYYHTDIKSFSRGTTSTLYISKSCLSSRDKVLILDDFLAHGETAKGLVNLVQQAGGTVCGITAVIEKEFQGGSKKLRDMGYLVDSLLVIDSISDGVVHFKENGTEQDFLCAK